MSKAKVRKKPDQFKKSYEFWSDWYDWLADLFSFQLIKASKEVHLSSLNRDDRVLYPGMGSGQEMVAAVRAGAKVTGIDISPQMVKKAKNRLANSGWKVELCESDVKEHLRPCFYDLIAAHYFLNLYRKDEAIIVLRRLAEQLKQNGLIVVADFAYPGKNPNDALTHIYYWTINLIGACLGLAKLHPPHDYKEYFSYVGLHTVKSQRIGFGKGPALFQVWIGRKD